MNKYYAIGWRTGRDDLPVVYFRCVDYLAGTGQCVRRNASVTETIIYNRRKTAERKLCALPDIVKDMNPVIIELTEKDVIDGKKRKFKAMLDGTYSGNVLLDFYKF